MRTRRIAVSGETTLEAVAPGLAELGYRRVDERFERGGILLTEWVSLEEGQLVYRYATSHLAWGLLNLALVASALVFTAWLAPLVVDWLAHHGLGPHILLTFLVYFVSLLICYSPFTWVYAAFTAPGFQRERATLDVLLNAQR